MKKKKGGASPDITTIEVEPNNHTDFQILLDNDATTIPTHMFPLGTMVYINNPNHLYYELLGHVLEIHTFTNSYTIYIDLPIRDQIIIQHQDLDQIFTGGVNTFNLRKYKRNKTLRSTKKLQKKLNKTKKKKKI